MLKKFVFFVFFIPVSLLGGLDWYLSDPGASLGDFLPEGSPDAGTWVLSLEEQEDEETRILYQAGVIHKKIMRFYEEGRLMSREEYAPDGTILLRVNYSYDENGAPRRAVMIQGDEISSTLIGRQRPDGAVWRGLHGAGDNWRIEDRDEFGRSLRYRVVDQGEVQLDTLWHRNEDGSRKEEHLTRDGEHHINLFDSAGQLVSETILGDSGLRISRDFIWEEGKLLRVEERGRGGLALKEYTWEEDLIVEEVHSRNGATESVIRRDKEGGRVENFYRNEQLVVRVFWEKDSKIREEFLVNGKVVRINRSGP